MKCNYSIIFFCMILSSCFVNKMYRKGNVESNIDLIDPWNDSKSNLKTLPFSLNLNSDWIIKRFEDIDGSEHGFFYKPYGDTINYKIVKNSINLNAVSKHENMSYYEDLLIQGRRIKIFNENSNWIGYYVHSDSLFNVLEVKNTKDEVLIKNILRNYFFN